MALPLSVPFLHRARHVSGRQHGICGEVTGDGHRALIVTPHQRSCGPTSVDAGDIANRHLTSTRFVDDGQLQQTRGIIKQITSQTHAHRNVLVAATELADVGAVHRTGNKIERGALGDAMVGQAVPVRMERHLTDTPTGIIIEIDQAFQALRALFLQVLLQIMCEFFHRCGFTPSDANRHR